MNDFTGLLWLIVLLFANAFFVGSEFAVVTARRSAIEPLADEGGKRAKSALFAMEHATLMLAATQLGNTICSLLILNVSEPAIHNLLAVPLSLLPISETVIDVIAFIVALVLVSFLHVVFGEMVPKNMTFSAPDRAVLLLAPTLLRFERLFKPFVWALNMGADLILQLFGIQPKHETESAFTLDQVATIVAESKRQGMLVDASGTLQKTFEFTTKKALDVAIPCAEIVTLPETATPYDIEAAVRADGYSRFVLTDAKAAMVGYVHIKDIIDLSESEYDKPLPAKRVRALTSIAAGTELEDALSTMQRLGAHVARVFDSEGTVVGVLFFEDILEILVGEVHDSTQRR